ncbi:TPR-like protein [Trametopsis cervina]|nr:TPR-like protein [Trametopsis cervina]
METTVVNADMITELRGAVRDCSERGLSFATKWASDLLLSIPASKRVSIHTTDAVTSTPARSRGLPSSVGFPPLDPHTSATSSDTPLAQDRHPDAPRLQPIPTEIQAQERQLEAFEEDIIYAAQALMNTKEYVRAAHRLQGCKSAKATFLRVYSQFLGSEQRAAREWYKLDGTKIQPSLPVNTMLRSLLEQVQDATDPWLLFLKALFLRRLSRREEALESALLSIASCPWNWSTWTLIGECLGDGEELSSMLPLFPLPATHPLVQMFQVKTLNTLSNPSENELSLCDRLLQEDLFPNSTWIMSLRACVLYHLHDFGQAEAQFKKLLELEPNRVDDIDVYSNILYVNENRLELSKLAHDFIAMEKDRPEICCLIGNLYSLKSDHVKAIKYFRRATQLDRTYLSAWTLMGHEYVETKNSHAAIEAYRKAVDVNRKDYRAWYGLGQAYELLSMQEYALYYYQHATSLRPYDVRIWQALGMCYQEMSRYREAIECLKRALIGADPFETAIRSRMADIHMTICEYREAAACHSHIIETFMADNRPIAEYAASCVQFARYHLYYGGDNLELARMHMENVAASNSDQATAATDLLKKIRAELARKSSAAGATMGVLVPSMLEGAPSASVVGLGLPSDFLE